MTKIAIWAFLLGAVTAATPVIQFAGVWLSDVFLALATFLAMLAHLPRIIRIPASVAIAVVIASLGIATASLASQNPYESLGAGVKILYVWLFLGMGIAILGRKKPGFALGVLQSYAFGASLSAIAAIAQATLGLEVPGSLVQHNRMPGLTGHPNAQGAVLGQALPMVLGMLLVKKSYRTNIACFALISAGLVLSGSVSGMISALLGCLIVLALSKRLLKGITLLLGLVWTGWVVGNRLPTIVPGAKSPWDRFADTTGYGEGESTLDIRQQTWVVAWEKIQQSPIVGYGLDPESGATVGSTLTHNILILVWYQGGLALLLSFVIVLTLALVHLTRASLSMRENSIVLPLIGGCAAAIAAAMTGPQLYDRWFWLPVLIAIYAAPQRKNRPKIRSRPSYFPGVWSSNSGASQLVSRRSPIVRSL